MTTVKKTVKKIGPKPLADAGTGVADGTTM
jgi:hypothetical protein